MNLQSQKIQTALNLATGMLTVIVHFAVSFFLSPFIVRTLGAEANGFSQLANNFVMYASLITIAFNSMAGRFVSVSYHQGELDKARKYYSSVVVANIAICILLIPIAVWIVFNLQDVVVIENADVIDVKILFLCVFFNFFAHLISSMYSIALYVKNAIFYNNLINAIRTILNALLLLSVFSIFPARIFYISLVAFFLTLCILPILRKLQRKLLPEVQFSFDNFSIKHVKDLFLAGIWNTVNQCGHLLNTGLDILLANWFISPFYMGVLAISKTIPSAIIQLATTINGSFSPSITKTWAEGNRNKMLQELRTAMKISTIVVSIPIVTFCCFGYNFYKLWQPSLDPTLLTILSCLAFLAFIPVAGTQTLYNVFSASNKLKVNSISFIINGVLNVILVYLAIVYFPNYAIYALAGISSILSIIRNLSVTLPYTAHLLNYKWYEFFKDVGITLAATAVNVLIAIPIVLFCSIQGWIAFIFAILLSVIITLVADCFIVLNKRERTIFFQLLKIKR